MVELDERTRRDLAALRERGEPNEQVRERVLAQLESGLGFDGGPPEGGGLSPGAAQGGSAYAAKVVAATLSLTAGGLLLLKTGAVLLRERTPAHVEVPLRVESRESTPRSRANPASAPVQDPAPSPTPSPASDDDEPTRAPPKSRAEPGDVDPDTIAAELALLDAARATSDAATRLGHLEEHLERFPKGVMASERDALRATALCELGRLDEARVLAEQFLRDNPRSPHRSRVLKGCAQLELE